MAGQFSLAVAVGALCALPAILFREGGTAVASRALEPSAVVDCLGGDHFRRASYSAINSSRLFSIAALMQAWA
jgi:hypothetical protein